MGNSTASLDAGAMAYAANHVAEDESLTAARQRATELGISPIGAGSGAALRLLAAAISAKNVVEIGTGTGVSSLWLLRGMADNGILTSIDAEHEHQRAARQTLASADIEAHRYRLIAGRAMDVLPRLTDGAYDMVFIDADKAEYPAYLEQALRLLHVGGIVAIDNALWSGKVADPAQRDSQTVTLRSLGTEVAESGRLISALLPVGDGLLVAVVTPETQDA